MIMNMQVILPVEDGDELDLIILVLMQEGKEAGLGSLTGAADSGTYWSKNKGRSKEGTLIKVTTFFTIVFFVTAAILCSRFI